MQTFGNIVTLACYLLIQKFMTLEIVQVSMCETLSSQNILIGVGKYYALDCEKSSCFPERLLIV